MADAYKTLYQGQLPSSVATLATVPTSKSWIVGHITLRNTLAVPVSYELFKNGSTAAFSLGEGVIPAKGRVVFAGKMSMAQAEYIAGVAGTASAVTMTMDGDEVT